MANKNWRPAKAIEKLKTQLNALYPNRDKISDGIVGDLSHSARKSDHNPNDAGVVCAMDITNNRRAGIDCAELAQTLQNSGDKRIKYLIFNGQITQKTDITKWKKYSGLNAHEHHLHISVASDAALYDSDANWKLSGESEQSELFYTVKAGDTVSALLRRFSLTMLEFYQLNNFNGDNFDPDNIKPGDKFKTKLR